MTTAVEWRCGPPAGEYTMIWSSCAHRQMCLASLSVACVGFPLCNRDWFQNSSSKTLRLFIVFFGSQMENLMEMFYFVLGAQIKFHSLAPALFVCAYLAVKTDDLCTVFAVKFMCYSDKAGGSVCVSVSVWFMSVYWDHRLQDCLLEDTNNLPWECKVPPVPNPIPYLQHSHMSDVYCPPELGPLDHCTARTHMQMEYIYVHTARLLRLVTIGWKS